MIRSISRPTTDAQHLDFIRSLPCLICGRPAEAAHIRIASHAHGKPETGKSQKPSGRWCIPLCPGHHRLGNDSQHVIGERNFWPQHDIDPFTIAALLFVASGNCEAALSIIGSCRLFPWKAAR
jgi:hypothetical protein